MLVYECLMIMLMLCKSSYARLTPEVLQVAQHVKLILHIAACAVRGVRIPVNSMGGFFILATLKIGVLRQASIAHFDGFVILGDAVVADMKDPTPKSWQKRGAARDGIDGALGVRVGALIQDVLERIIWYLTNSHHVYHGRRLIGLRQINLVEVVNAVARCGR